MPSIGYFIEKLSYEGGNNTCWYFIVWLVFVRVLGDGI
jgi:hypothetical protein